ncbi:unnamed protein product [Rhizophagus irregularis]|uniref:HTH myb-type domain-containing protein n=1 Tax=Rhizophagus irregularis TaxID=588596 RepID=A0A2N1P286_9GLOM|nr:hypothetical protein RhiirC2_704379 [Rhizophagus irregularis]CAB4393822.1 unnamed protein product [Rhizophagus irregularis]CAB5318479.1 unnamed protein product [Rhizophagus irregularis]
MEYQSESEKKQYNKIDPDSEKIIVDYMQKWINKGKIERNPFAQISKLIPYSAKKICHHWMNKMDPKLRLVKDVPFTLQEKEYIVEWVEDYLNSNNKIISWKLLQSKMKEKFGILRSRNDLKNIWYVKKRQTTKRTKNGNRVNIESVPSVPFVPLIENHFFMRNYVSYSLQPPSYPESVANVMIMENFNYFECISRPVIPLR